MKGIIFNQFEAYVVAKHGEATWEAIVDAAPPEARQTHVGPGTYPDQHLLHLVAAACAHSQQGPEVVVRDFGKFLFFGLAQRYPRIAEQFPTPRAMLEGIDSVIHVEVNKLLPGAVTPTITVIDEGPDNVTLVYDSRRKMCTLLEGLLDGMCQHYGVTMARSHDVCTHKGAARCELKIRLLAGDAAAA